MNFVLCEMTYLRYFVPLILEGNKRGISSTVFWGENTKYNNPCQFLNNLVGMSKQVGFKLAPLSELHNNYNATFMVEGIGLSHVNHKSKKICLTSMRDFTVHYSHYIDNVDQVIFCSRFMAEHYGTISDKNIYLGSPKYDVVLDDSIIRCKYGIENVKVALIIFPRLTYMNKSKYSQLLKIYSYLKQMGYLLIVKTRGKDKVQNDYKGDRYFEDFSWYPHTTQELIKLADIVINFDSTSIKECIMMSKPLINFSIKPIKRFEFMYNDNYALNVNMGINYEKFSGLIERLHKNDLSKCFYDAREAYLFQPGNVSSKIIDEVLK